MRCILLIGAICLFLPMMALGRPAPVETTGPVLVVLPPWIDAHGVVEEAGGQIIGFDRAAFAVLAIGAHPDFHRALRAAGAWAVRDGSIIASLC